MHLFQQAIQWCQHQMVISTFHQVIKVHHPEDLSRLKEKCQYQIPMTPSSNHWLFSFTVFLKGNTGSSLSRDIQEAVPKQFAKLSFLISECQNPRGSSTEGQLDREPHLEGEAPSGKEGRGERRSIAFSGVVGHFPGLSRTTFEGPGEDGEEEEENSVEEEESEGTEGVPAPVGVSQGTGGPSLAQSNQPVSHQSEPSLLAVMKEMTQIISNIQAASSSEELQPPACKTQSIKAPECFDGTQPLKFRSFIQSCQLIFHNYLEDFSQDGKKVLYATSFLIGSASKWIELYLSNITNQDPSYLLNSWTLFQSKLFTLFGHPNEARKTKSELDSLRIE
ncbi:hypothetical protein O181_028715 [Austropuccinia psidii MF-1]|uniref:DUF4939 domain-containing protein n=1 Tax=Austropuccinia psidii MF-1 TaxID=1389203 RepID=A0A9Q3CT87_9BASI|nr:hypothetical protein [Austropuccinia psidii MF-1]